MILQDAIDEQEEAKNWLVARVLQQENEVAEITEELERAKDECEKQEKLIQSLQNQARFGSVLCTGQHLSLFNISSIIAVGEKNMYGRRYDV